jgi:hypothetical protein
MRGLGNRHGKHVHVVFTCMFTVHLLMLLSMVNVCDSVTSVKIGVLLMTNATEPFDLRRTGPALELAFDYAEREYGIRFDVVYHNYSGYCPKDKAVGHLAELYYHHQVKVRIFRILLMIFLSSHGIYRWKSVSKRKPNKVLYVFALCKF